MLLQSVQLRHTRYGITILPINLHTSFMDSTIPPFYILILTFQIKKDHHHVHPSILFSVDIRESIITTSSMMLSAIQIKPHWFPPRVQTLHKIICFIHLNQSLLTWHNHWFTFKYGLLRFLRFPLLFIQRPKVFYSLTGTGHVLLNISSLDINRQHRYINDIVSTMKRNTIKLIGKVMAPTLLPTTSDLPVNCIPHYPYYFVADTYSIMFVVDCSTSRVI